MSTLIWILIAIVAAVVVIAVMRARGRNAIDDPEDTEEVEQGGEQIANAGTVGQDRASSVLRPLPDSQTGQTDPARHAALGGDPGTDGQDRVSSVLRPLPDTQTGLRSLSDTQAGQSHQARRAALGSELDSDGHRYAQLLEDHEMQSILGQWKDIQAAFVDEPRKAVQDADALVAELMQRLAEMFATEREQLESQWAGGADVSTEDLRRGLRRYRSFFERLLSA
jgi:hypothetical protein